MLEFIWNDSDTFEWEDTDGFVWRNYTGISAGLMSVLFTSLEPSAAITPVYPSITAVGIKPNVEFE